MSFPVIPIVLPGSHSQHPMYLDPNPMLQPPPNRKGLSPIPPTKSSHTPNDPHPESPADDICLMISSRESPPVIWTSWADREDASQTQTRHHDPTEIERLLPQWPFPKPIRCLYTIRLPIQCYVPSPMLKWWTILPSPMRN